MEGHGRFTALVAGSGFRDYKRLREVLDKVLANRLPDVTLITTGGPGLPALVASYARARGLSFLPIVLDYERHPGNAPERRDADMVAGADAAVVFTDKPDGKLYRLLSLIRGRRLPLVIVEPQDRSRRSNNPAERFLVGERPRGLPD